MATRGRDCGIAGWGDPEILHLNLLAPRLVCCDFAALSFVVVVVVVVIVVVIVICHLQ
ncbi:hypothetical protein GQ607_004569 [Colletotrichum asianum]|uniref:Transmembrane protein n=1 Tax=Colletotrichum asianum TaxID=702518 RepID=A0A8H3ZPY9_9PEZI|nr:hypothetical protein GQ607_004569 [Colletotrichum asianum]